MLENNSRPSSTDAAHQLVMFSQIVEARCQAVWDHALGYADALCQRDPDQNPTAAYLDGYEAGLGKLIELTPVKNEEQQICLF